MKKIIITALTIFTLTSIYGQKKLNIGLVYHNTSISDKIEEEPFFRDRLEPGTGFGIYVTNRFDFSSRIGLSVGLEYDKSVYALNKNDWRWPSQIDPEKGFIPAHISPQPGALGNVFGERTFHSISIPILLHAKISDFKYGSIKVRGGLLPKYYLSATNRVEVSDVDEVTELDVWMLKTNLTALIGFELHLFNNDNFSVAVIPSLSTEIFSSSLNDEGHRIRFASLGLEIGIF